MQHCETVQSSFPLKAALEKEDEELLHHIPGKDLVAILASLLIQMGLSITGTPKSVGKSTLQHSAAYSVFKEKVIFKKTCEEASSTVDELPCATA